MPIGESIISPRSYCPQCKKNLSYRDLIPILSWLINLGKCRYCNTKIHIRYLYVELITSILFVCCLYSNPSSLNSYNQILIIIYGWILVSINIVLTFIDIEVLWLPSKITNSGILIGLLIQALQFVQNDNSENYSIFTNHLKASILIFIVLRAFSHITKIIIKKDILGRGDANLMALAGAWLGTTGIEIVAIQTILLSGTFSGISIISGFLKRGSYIPLGAFIAPSIIATWILGNDFWVKNLGNLLWWRYI